MIQHDFEVLIHARAHAIATGAALGATLKSVWSPESTVSRATGGRSHGSFERFRERSMGKRWFRRTS